MGPMKSGKSLELIARVAPYEFAHKKVLYVQSNRDVRDQEGIITSRAGINTKATRVASLGEVKNNVDVIGIDEVHMFDEDDARFVQKWLKKGKEVFASGLDLDYSATITPMVKRLLELKPERVITKTSVCEACHEYRALFTQILYRGRPVLGGLPPIVPEDGTYVYQARCRDCYQHPAYTNKIKQRGLWVSQEAPSRA